MSPTLALPAPAHPTFLDPSAVEAWDAWFRWRCDGELRDVTIEDSWARVARTLASVEADPAAWEAHFTDALANWRTLPDPRVLRSAGTGRHDWPASDLVAALNVAAFVRSPFTRRAAFDDEAFEACAETAVRMLDNALLLVAPSAAPPARLRIGLAGLADALCLLGVGYASEPGHALARRFARLLTRGAWRASLQLARERGGARPPAAWLAAARDRGVDDGLIEQAAREGLRHSALTAITPLPQLTLLANNLSDALDPLCAEDVWRVLDAPGEARHLRSPAYAQQMRRRHLATHGGTLPALECDSELGVLPQIAMRGALRGCFDAPIDYAYCAHEAPNPASIDVWRAEVERLGLPPVRWRRCHEVDPA